MHKVTTYRVFRFLVCLLVICCLIVNISPIRAQATVVAGAAIAGTGVAATLFAMAMGIVFVDLTADLINNLGVSLENHLSSTTTDEEKDILKVWIEPLQVDLDSGGISQLPPEQDPESNGWGALAGLISIPKELLDNFIDWAKGLINGQGIEVQDPESVADGYSFYNGRKLPSLPDIADEYPAAFIFSSAGIVYLVLCQSITSTSPVYDAGNFTNVTINYTGPSLLCPNYTGKSVWTVPSSEDTSTSRQRNMRLIWSSVDIPGINGNPTFLGSIPSEYATEVITPIYVGDIPAQVQDGSFDEEKYELPYINYSQIFQGQTDAIEAMNNVATQLQNQTMTYEQFMDQIKTPVNTGGSGASGGNSGGSSGDQTTSPVPELAPYIFDLKDFFPFCIPFDLYDFFSVLAAEPEAPKFHWEIQDLSGKTYTIEIDLSPWDDLASFFRILQLLLFITGLAAASRKFIKW